METEHTDPAPARADPAGAGADVVDLAVERLQQLTGWKLAILGGETDGDPHLRIDRDGHRHVLPLEVKTRIAAATVGLVHEQLANRDPCPVLVTRHVSPALGARLRELDIQYLDTAGNGYLNVDPLFLLVDGRRPREKLEAVPPERPLNPAAIKLLFALLCRPDTLQQPLREMAERAGIALGTAQYVFKEFVRGRHIIGKTAQRRFRDPDTETRRWVEAFLQRLRPKLLVGRYRAADREWWRHVEPLAHDAAWGGEVAGMHLTEGYLQPATVTLYVARPPNRLILEHGLKRDPEGDIEVLNRFWHFDADSMSGVAPPLLVYADLVGIADTRTIEVAEMVRERHLV